MAMEPVSVRCRRVADHAVNADMASEVQPQLHAAVQIPLRRRTSVV
jgi:hypothetical protein